MKPHPLRTTLAFVAATLLPGLAGPEDGNPVFDLAEISAPGASYALRITDPVALFDTRQAKRRLDTLPGGQDLLVLGLDRFGLRVRGTGKNGPLTGWLSQRHAFRNDSARLDQVASFFDRQIEIERLVAAKTPAIGMSRHELTRIFGPATSHNIEAVNGKQSETMQWTRSEKVDLNDTLDLGTDAALLKVEVETGRITVQLADGVATSIARNVQGAPNNAIPTVAKPVALPFGGRPAGPLAGAAAPDE